MRPDPTDVTTSLAADSVPEPHGVEEGIALVLRAEDHGDWKPVVDWLARNPAAAAEVAEFLTVQAKLRPPTGWAAPPPAGMVGGMELREEVGRGGMGVVYRAFDPALKRDVAVKMVLAGTALSPTELARFQFEAETVAGLDHPNIVRVLSYGEAGGAPYLVMPLMTDGSLAQRLKDLGPDRRLPPAEAARLVRDIARGVHHAHQRGLIHRDMKPANVLLDGDGVPHVADFGLARRVDVTAHTSAGFAGTVAYMAPEQARGEKTLTTAVDVYALGVVLFELLTGGVPYAGANVASILRRLTDDAEPVPPVRRLRPDVPADLEAVCAKCLEKRPEDRYASAQELADDLTRFLDNEPIKVGPRGLFSRVRRALAWRRETQSMVTWQGFAFGAANTLVNHAAVAVLLLLDCPRAAFGVLMYHVLSWGAFVWWFGVRKVAEFNTVERAGLASHIGAILAVAVTLPVVLTTHGPSAAGVYPVYNAVIGSMLFATGAVHLGRHYFVGLIWMSQNLLLPFLPVWAWAALHGVVGGAIHVWAAAVLWRIDRSGRALSPTASPSD